MRRTVAIALIVVGLVIVAAVLVGWEPSRPPRSGSGTPPPVTEPCVVVNQREPDGTARAVLVLRATGEEIAASPPLPSIDPAAYPQCGGGG